MTPNSTNASPLQELVKDPYVLEFTGILQDERFLEKKRGSALITKLRQFLLELAFPAHAGMKLDLRHAGIGKMRARTPT
jgi:predicted nuclease of restriction endonuclease-like (RecB) superfamily